MALKANKTMFPATSAPNYRNPQSLLAFWFLDYSLDWQLVWFCSCFAFHWNPTLFDIIHSVSPSPFQIHKVGINKKWDNGNSTTTKSFFWSDLFAALQHNNCPHSPLSTFWQRLLKFLIYSFIFFLLIKHRKLLKLVWLCLMIVSSWASHSLQEIQTVN